MAKYRPDIKPPMWGPPEAVQYAVRANAERLGVSPAWLIPIWENSGTVARDVFAGGEATLSGISWNVSEQCLSGFTYSGPQALVLPSTDLYRLSGQENVTVIISVYLGAWGNEFPHLWAVRDASTSVSSFGVGADIAVDTPSNYRRPYITQGAANYGVSALNVIPENAQSTIAFSMRSGNVDFYQNGELVGSSSGPGAFGASTITPLVGNRVSGGRGLPSGRLYYAYAFHNEFSRDTIAQLYATPYALLMPVSRPVYFDLGASGNTDSSADPVNIAISGSSATGVKTSVSSASSGTIAIAGSVASGLRSLVSLATAASIAIAGFSAEGVYTPTGSTVSSAGPGTVAISGAPANGVQTHISSADPGTIAILGSDANGATGYATTAEPGTVAITGADATASRTYVATASPTSVAISGSPAFASKSGGSSTSSGISLIFGKVILHL